MADILSQSEIESLLAALELPAGSASSRNQGTVGRQTSESPSPPGAADVGKSQQVSQEQLRGLRSLHEGFGRDFGTRLGGLLRAAVEVRLISVSPLTFCECLFSLENSASINLLESQLLEGGFLLELNPSIVFPLIDRLLGGGRGEEGEHPGRPLTDIEQRVIGRVVALAAAALEGMWRNVGELSLAVTMTESNPHRIQIVPPQATVLLFRFEISMGEVRGIMNLGIPVCTLQPLLAKFSTGRWRGGSRASDAGASGQRTDAEATSADAVELVVQLAKTSISAGAAMCLDVGDVIATSQGKDDPVTVLADGRPLFHASPGVLKGRKAVQIVEAIVPADEVEVEG